MNYLAHLYLSGHDEEIIIGNFIGDYVKGKAYREYPEKIKKGIILHRHIDDYTDHHDIINKSKLHFTEKYHKYSGIIIDIFFDHFLTQHWSTFSKIPFDLFTEKLRTILTKYYDIYPKSVKYFFPWFIRLEWLEHYQSIEGVANVLLRMTKRTSLPHETKFAIRILKEKYDLINSDFLEYFPQIIYYVETKFDIKLDYDPDQEQSEE